MAQFSIRNAKEIFNQQSFITYKMQEAVRIPDRLKGEIKAASDTLLSFEVYKLLQSIPVDELNKNKEGFKIKTLKDNNINTLADIYNSSAATLYSIKGISEEAAYNMKHRVSEYANKAKQAVKLRLTSDDKNRYSTSLVKKIAIYKNMGSYVEECIRLLDFEPDKIEKAMQALKPATGALRWLVTSRVKKEQAMEAFDYLTSLLESGYGRSSAETLAGVSKLKNMTDKEAWDDFFKDSAAYFTTLERTVPGILGNDESVYGLPELLANEIKDVFYSTEGLKCTLRRYQEWGVKYILHQERVLLGDEMGLGKTVQAIAAMVSLRNAGATHFVVVCPASVLSNWCKEIEKFSSLRFTDVYGYDRTEELEDWKKNGGVAVTTYETAEHFHMEDDFVFSMLIVDEAHYIKNPNAQRTANVIRIGKHAKRMLFMTGTALENKVDEMIALINILQPEVAKRVQKLAFMSSAPQFREAIAPVYYRRKREDVLTELPELMESKEWCRMTPEEEKVYEESILSGRYTDARRVSFNIDDLSCSSKATRLEEIVLEAESDGRKVLVFSFFLDTVYKVKKLLGERCLDIINGSVPPARRQEIIDEFDKAGAGAVLVAQIQSGGTGLNIQSASVVVICEPQFKPSTENQAISRAYRMGQTRNVLVYRLLCENSIDEKIVELLNTKQAIFDAFADESEAAKADAKLAMPDIDDEGFMGMVQEELERIRQKRGCV